MSVASKQWTKGRDLADLQAGLGHFPLCLRYFGMRTQGRYYGLAMHINFKDAGWLTCLAFHSHPPKRGIILELYKPLDG